MRFELLHEEKQYLVLCSSECLLLSIVDPDRDPDLDRMLVVVEQHQ